MLQAFLRNTTRREFLLDAIAIILLTAYGFQMAKRRSLRWNVTRLLFDLRVPTQIDLSRVMSELFRFNTFYSVVVVCAIVLGLIFSPWVLSLIASTKLDFYLALWQVHAAFVGFFLVLLTFVFQFVSVKWAYEANLLPSMERRAMLPLVLIVNLISLLYEMIVSLLESGGHSIVIVRGFEVFVITFSIISALFVLLKVQRFLSAESLEECLNEDVQHELRLAIEAEQRRALTQYLMERECESLGLEYSPYDFNNALPAILASKSGIVADVNLRRLRRFARALSGTISSSKLGQSRSCLLLNTIGDQLRDGIDVLARVSVEDDTPKKHRLLFSAYEMARTD